jgi:PadR family transcriptional regulator AphA
VLGLVEVLEPATPYALKQFAGISVFNFWTLPHTQVYTECSRLAAAGYLTEDREAEGRRRRIYRLTEEGRAALDRWRSTADDNRLEYRDEAMLKLFFGGARAELADSELASHSGRLREYEQLHREQPEMADGMRLALEAGIALEREYVRFWERVRG